MGSLADAAPEERPALIRQKLEAASRLYDFTNDSDPAGKAEKRQTLLELVEHANNSREAFPEELLPAMVAMIRHNVCRALPPRTAHADDDEEPVLDPSWPHLQIVYEFLLRLVVSKEVDSKCLKRNLPKPMIAQLVGLFDSEDPRERDYLKTIVHRIYGKGTSLRAFIRKSINNELYRFIYEDEGFMGVAELLEILGSIINGFAVPLKPEHVRFLHRVLIPLHKSTQLAGIHAQLAYCATQYVEKSPDTAKPLLLGLTRYWPHLSSPKRVLFLNEMEELLELTQPAEFGECAAPLFTQIANALNSEHFQVAQRAIALFNNEYVVSLIAQQRAAVLPAVYPALFAATNEHWNSTVQTQAFSVLKLFSDMDPALYDRVSTRSVASVEEASKRRRDAEARWVGIEAEAAPLPTPPPASS